MKFYFSVSFPGISYLGFLHTGQWRSFLSRHTTFCGTVQILVATHWCVLPHSLEQRMIESIGIRDEINEMDWNGTYYTRKVSCWDLWLVGQPVSSQKLTWNLKKKQPKRNRKSIWTKPNLPFWVQLQHLSFFFGDAAAPILFVGRRPPWVGTDGSNGSNEPRSTPFHPWLNKAHQPAWS